MKITKFGHCCLLIEEAGLKILTDPGDYTTGQNQVTGVNIILITHEHSDHLHIPSLKMVLQNNPLAKVVTNRSVGLLLDKENIPYAVVEDEQSLTEQGVLLEAFGRKHHFIYEGVPELANTGYFINHKLFYPGDALTNPDKPVEILALPLLAPWLKFTEAVDYAKLVKPKTCFPVHDGMLKMPGNFYKFPQTRLEPLGIKFIPLEIGEPADFV